MNPKFDLKGSERESFKLAAYTDGTADLSLGLVYLLLGVYPYTRKMLGPAWNFPLFLGALGTILFAQIWFKKRFSSSRIGIVKLGQRYQKRTRVVLLITVLLFTLTVLTWVGAADGMIFSLSAWMGRYGMEILVALVILAIFWGIAYIFKLPRYYLYGILLAACFPLQQQLPIYDGIPFLAAGAIITTIGVGILTRFLGKYPDLGEEGIDG